MATRTELLCYQLGLRLFQARELHDPSRFGPATHFEVCDQTISVMQLGIARLQGAIDLLHEMLDSASNLYSALDRALQRLDTPVDLERLHKTSSDALAFR